MLSVLSCVQNYRGELKQAVSALGKSIKLLKAASPPNGGPGAPRPSDFFDRYQRMATLQQWAGHSTKAQKAVDKAIATQDPDASAVLLRHRGEAVRALTRARVRV